MSGFMEIILIVVIVIGIFMLPRLINRKPESEPLDRGLRFSGWMRTAILASLLWLAILALFLKPWNNHWHIFFYSAVGPVALAWGIFWVFTGFRKEGK